MCGQVTVGADKRTCLAFLGYIQVEFDIVPGLGAFAKMELSSWVESWLRALEAKELRYSTMANCAPDFPAYGIPNRSNVTCAHATDTNSLISMTSYVYNTFKVDDAVLSAHITPLDELLRLRCGFSMRLLVWRWYL